MILHDLYYHNGLKESQGLHFNMGLDPVFIHYQPLLNYWFYTITIMLAII